MQVLTDFSRKTNEQKIKKPTSQHWKNSSACEIIISLGVLVFVMG